MLVLLAMVLISKVSTFVGTASHNNTLSLSRMSVPVRQQVRVGVTETNIAENKYNQDPSRPLALIKLPAELLLDNNHYLLQTGNGIITSGSVTLFYIVGEMLSIAVIK